MKPELAEALRTLLASQRVAALGTLHDREPFVSMVPYAIVPHGQGLVVHVSRLAAHTRDMLADPAVSVLVAATPAADASVLGLARVTLQGEARPCGEDDVHHAAAKRAYLARFPESEPMFGFADFSLFVIAPRSARFVGGFAQAASVGAETLRQVLAAAA